MLLLQDPDWGPHPLPFPECEAAVQCVVAQIEWPQVPRPEERAQFEWEFLGAFSGAPFGSAALSCVWHDWPLMPEPPDPEDGPR